MLKHFLLKTLPLFTVTLILTLAGVGSVLFAQDSFSSLPQTISVSPSPSIQMLPISSPTASLRPSNKPTPQPIASTQLTPSPAINPVPSLKLYAATGLPAANTLDGLSKITKEDRRKITGITIENIFLFTKLKLSNLSHTKLKKVLCQ